MMLFSALLSGCMDSAVMRAATPRSGALGEPLLPARDPDRALVIFARMPDCEGDLGHRTLMCDSAWWNRIAVVEEGAVVTDLGVGEYTAISTRPGEHLYAASFARGGCWRPDCVAALVARVEAGAVYLVTLTWHAEGDEESGRTHFSILDSVDVPRYQRWMRTARRLEPGATYVRGPFVQSAAKMTSLAKERVAEDAARGEPTPWLDRARAVAWDEPIPPPPRTPRHIAESEALPDVQPFDALAARAALSDVDLSSCRAEGARSTWGHASVIINPDGRISKVVIDEPGELDPETVECIGTKLGRVTVSPFRGSLVKIGTTWLLH